MMALPHFAQDTRQAPKAGTLDETGAGQPGGTTAPGSQQRPPMGGCFDNQTLFIFVPFLLLLYFLMIRPQQKQEKARKAMLSAVQKNDRVITTGGIHGTVASLTEREAVLKLDPEGKLRVTIDRAAIARIERDEPPREKDGDSGAEKGG